MGSNTEKKHWPIYKTYTKIEAKGLRATTRAITKGGAIEKSPIFAIAISPFKVNSHRLDGGEVPFINLYEVKIVLRAFIPKIKIFLIVKKCNKWNIKNKLEEFLKYFFDKLNKPDKLKMHQWYSIKKLKILI